MHVYIRAKVKEMSTKKSSKSGTNCIRDKMGKCYSIQMTLLIDGLNMSMIHIMTRKVTHQMSVTRMDVLLLSQEYKM